MSKKKIGAKTILLNEDIIKVNTKLYIIYKYIKPMREIFDEILLLTVKLKEAIWNKKKVY